MRTALSAVAIAALWLGLHSVAHAQPTDKDIDQAKVHFQEARAHLDGERYDQAIAAYEKAYALYPDAEFMFNIGEAYRLAGNKRKSLEYFEKYLELDPDGRGAGEARKTIAELRAELGDAGTETGAETDTDTDTDTDTNTDADTDADTDTDTDTDTSDDGDQPAPIPAIVATGELVTRPLQVGTGQVEASVAMRLQSGPYFNHDSGDWEVGTAQWSRVILGARYGVTDKLEVGIELPLIGHMPDKEEFDETPRIDVLVGARYAAHDSISVGFDVGWVGRARLMRSNYQLPRIDYESYPGARAGAAVKKAFGKIAVSGAATLAVQPKSAYDNDEDQCPPDDPDCWDTAFALLVPVAAHYQVAPTLAAGLRTGIYSGDQLSFDKWRGAAVPVVIEALLTVAGGKVDIGAEFGFANLLDPDDHDTSWPTEDQTMFFGLSAAYRNW